MALNYYTAAPSVPYNFREDMFKIDENITDNIRAFFRYTQDANDQDYLPTLYSGGTFGTVQSTLLMPAKSAVFHLIQTFRPNLLNEVVLSDSNDAWNVKNSTGFDSPARFYRQAARFFLLNSLFPGNQSQPYLPGISVGGGVPFNVNVSTGFRVLLHGSSTRHQGQPHLDARRALGENRFLSAL